MEHTTSSHWKTAKKTMATEEDLNRLRIKAFEERVAVGFKETLRAIKSQETDLVFLADHADYKTQKEIIEEYTKLNSIEIKGITDWVILRDIVMDCLPSELEREKAEKLGREAKLNPKCFCAALLIEKASEIEENN